MLESHKMIPFSDSCFILHNVAEEYVSIFLI